MSSNEIENNGVVSFRGPVVDQRVRRWGGGNVGVTIDYVSGILDEIAGYSEDGLQRLQRGGIEVGGILFGSLSGQAVRIEAWRPIPCEHAQGPSFALSARDQENLGRHLARFDEDSALTGLCPVGWFVSHTRSGVELTAKDTEIYDRFFPGKEQVVLVLKPARGSATRAGFFFREPDGRLRADSSHFEFPVESPVLPRPSRPGARSAVEENPAGIEPYRPRAQRPAPPPTSEKAFEVRMARPDNVIPPARGNARAWKLVAALATAVAAASLSFSYFKPPTVQPTPGSHPEFLGLNIFEEKGVVRVEWDRLSPVIAAAEKGRVIVTGNGAAAESGLNAEELKFGKFMFVRKGEDVRVRLTTFKKGAPTADELARYIGPPLPAPQQPEPLRPNRRDTQKLREQVDREKARADAAERLAKIYKDRLDLIGAPPR